MNRLLRPLVAYRAFLAEGGELYALSGHRRWGAGVVTARCDVGKDHSAPHRRCECGLYGVSSLALARRAMRRATRFHPWKRGKVVYGVVRYWGGDHDPVALDALRGGGVQVRAPFAQLAALARTELAVPLARRLGVPVVEEPYLGPWARETLDGEVLSQQVLEDMDAPTAVGILLGRLWWAVEKGARGLGWGLRYILPPVLMCSVALLGWAAAQVLRGLVLGLGAAGPYAWVGVLRVLRHRVLLVALLVGLVVLVPHVVPPPAHLPLLIRAAGSIAVLLGTALCIAIGVLLALRIPLSWARRLIPF